MGRKNKNARKRRRAKPLRIETLLEQHKHKLQAIQKIEEEIAQRHRRYKKPIQQKCKAIKADPLDGTMPIIYLSIGGALLIIVIVLLSLWR